MRGQVAGLTGRNFRDESITMSEIARAESLFFRAIGGRFGYLLITLIAFLLSTPLMTVGGGWSIFLGLFASAVLIASLQAAHPGRRSLVIGVVLAATDLGMGRIALMEGGRWMMAFQALLWLLTFGFVAMTILNTVFGRASVDVETLQASLCVFLMLGLIWVFVYAVVDLASPESFRVVGAPKVALTEESLRRSDFARLVVFSFGTLTSSTRGDLVASSQFASLLACLEAMSVQVYLAVVIARLVGKQSEAAIGIGTRGE